MAAAAVVPVHKGWHVMQLRAPLRAERAGECHSSPRASLPGGRMLGRGGGEVCEHDLYTSTASACLLLIANTVMELSVAQKVQGS